MSRRLSPTSRKRLLHGSGRKTRRPRPSSFIVASRRFSFRAKLAAERSLVASLLGMTAFVGGRGGKCACRAVSECNACGALTLSGAFSILWIPDLAGRSYLIDFSGNVWGLKRSFLVRERLRDSPSPESRATARHAAEIGGKEDRQECLSYLGSQNR